MFGKACQHVILSPLNGHVTEVISLMEREWSCYGGGQFNRGSMIVRGGQFNGVRMVMLQK